MATWSTNGNSYGPAAPDEASITTKQWWADCRARIAAKQQARLEMEPDAEFCTREGGLMERMDKLILGD